LHNQSLAVNVKMSNRGKWDERYAGPGRVSGPAAAEFLTANAAYLPTSGLALDLAAGEGRNSILLAARGLEVVAVDFSIHALKKCLHRARESNLRVAGIVADLERFVIPAATFDCIVNFNYLQRELAPAMIAGLRPGGVLVFETSTCDTLAYQSDFNAEYLLKRGELAQMFCALHLLKYRETRLPSKASFRVVASLIARKPERLIYD
jgi:SAM-dependent methyltransferase